MKKVFGLGFSILLLVGLSVYFRSSGTSVFAADSAAEIRKGSAGTKDMILIPAGEFMMGCNSAADDKCDDDEKPYHKVYLDSYYIDKYEVNVDQYAQCVRARKCSEYHLTGLEWPGHKDFTESKYCNWGKAGKGNHPMNCMDWSQADAFCAWAGKRLPTEAEWEKAARGTDGRIYPWGNDFDCHKGNFDDETELDSKTIPGGPNCDGFQSTSPVGSFPAGASPYGVMDMSGNVWEWVLDWYGKEYYGKSSFQNPQGASSGEFRALRGGSWFRINPEYFRASGRVGYDPAKRVVNFGVRCVRGVK